MIANVKEINNNNNNSENYENYGKVSTTLLITTVLIRKRFL